MANLFGTEVPDELLALALQKRKEMDPAALDAALAEDRKAQERAVLAQNLSRAAAIYGGDRAVPGLATMPVDSGVKEFALRRKMQMDEGGDTLERLGKVAGIAKDLRPPRPEPVDPLLDVKRRKYEADIVRLKRGPAPKAPKAGDEPPDEAQVAEMEKLKINPALAKTRREASQLIREAMSGTRKRAEEAEAKRKMLSDAQIKILNEFDTGISNLDFIEREKEGIDTGPAAAAKNKAASWVGVDDPRTSSFRAAVGDSLATYIRSLSGAAVSDRERAFLLQNVPKMEDNDQVFKAKLKMVRDRLKRIRAVHIENFRRQGKDVEEFGDEPASGTAAPSDPLGIR